jgi:hypothetical protein
MNRSARIFGVLEATIIALLMPLQLASAEPEVQDQYLVYISTAIYTTGPFPAAGKHEAIHAYRFDARAGQLTALGTAAETINPDSSRLIRAAAFCTW